jgi:UDP-N-acetylglucosamine 3-dehydrogenase
LSDNLGVAIVGLGAIGSVHYSAWKNVRNCNVRAIVSRSATKRKKISQTLGIRTYPTLQSALSDDGAIQIVDICTPPDSHCSLALASMNAGENVLVEKPISLSLKEIDEMDKTAEERKVKLMVAHVVRFFPAYAKAKELVDNGVIGEPVKCSAYRVGPTSDWNSWYTNKKISGGIVFDLSIHDIDFIRWCFGDEITDVYAKVRNLMHAPRSAEDFALISLGFSRDRRAFAESHFTMPLGFPFTTRFEVEGPKGILSFDSRADIVNLNQNSKLTRYHCPSGSSVLGEMDRSVQPYYNEIAHFVKCIRRNETPLVSAKIARKNIEIAIAAMESSRTNRNVNLSRSRS